MAQCTIEHLRHAFEGICKTISKDSELYNSIKIKMDALKQIFNSNAVTYCLEQYINSELDYKTPGDRGLGRMTTYIPRLAAYLRKQIANLSSQELNELYYLIQDLILRGYLASVLFIEESPKHSKVSESKELYEAWISGIYAEDPSQMSENLQKAFALCTDSAFVEIKEFFSKHTMKVSRFFSRDKTDTIISYYPFAGFGLRFEETKG